MYEMKKVVHVIISLNVGGAEKMMERLVIELSKDPSISQAVICLKGLESIGHRLQVQGFEVTSLGMKSLFGAPIAFYKLFKIFMVNRPSAVYTWMYHANLIGGLAAFFSGTKNIIWMIRNSAIPQGRFSLTSTIIKICSILSFYIPDKIVCNAEAGKSSHAKLGFCLANMIVIPNGYNLESFKPSFGLRSQIRKDLNLSDNTLLVGIVGRFDPLKDFRNFVQAAGLVSKNLDNVKFLMVGRDLDQNNIELKKWIDDTQYPDNFILIGETDPHDFYASMDIFCLSSKAEGFPNVVAEAMAMKVPCVVTDAGDAATIVGESGLVVESMNPYALYEGLMAMLIIDEQRRQSFGSVARELIEAQYDIGSVSQKLIGLIDSP
jgi:glycosyltransferase involved in cell wall biosynthesis